MPESDHYKINLEHGRALISTEQLLGRDFSKAILAFAGGALALSVTLVSGALGKTLLNSNLPNLYWSWFLFSLSILSTIYSFKTAQISFQTEIANLYENIDSNTSERYTGKWVSATAILEFLSLIFFIFGILFLMNFVSTNLNDREILQNGWQKPIEQKIDTNKEGTNQKIDSASTTTTGTKTKTEE